MPQKWRRYTPEEDQWIRDHFDSWSIRDMAKHLERPERSLQHRCRDYLKLTKHSLTEIRRNRPAESVIIAAYQEGVSPEALAQRYAIGAHWIRRVLRQRGLLRARGESWRIAHRRKYRNHPPRLRRWAGVEYLISWDAEGRYAARRVAHVQMEEKLGRALQPGERVFHLDGDPTNNHPDNLSLLPPSHSGSHRRVPNTELESALRRFVADSGRITTSAYARWRAKNPGAPYVLTILHRYRTWRGALESAGIVIDR